MAQQHPVVPAKPTSIFMSVAPADVDTPRIVLHTTLGASRAWRE
jgi:hypothetical protein